MTVAILSTARMDTRPFIDEWTGGLATALRNAKRMTLDEFAELLGFARRTILNWAAKPDMVPRNDVQRALDTVYERLTDAERTRFAHALDEPRPAPAVPPVPEVETATSAPASVGLTFGDDPQVVLDLDGRKVLVALDDAEQMARRLLAMVDAARSKAA